MILNYNFEYKVNFVFLFFKSFNFLTKFSFLNSNATGEVFIEIIPKIFKKKEREGDAFEF